MYLGEDSRSGETERVLLPGKQVPEGTRMGDQLEEFIYKDSSDRLIATTRMPLITLHQTALLTVAEVGKIGAFLEWGLERLAASVPGADQAGAERQQQVLVGLYIDKSSRLCNYEGIPLSETEFSVRFGGRSGWKSV